MKITEPKTPYTRRYDPAEDPSDDEMEAMQLDAVSEDDHTMKGINDIPGLDIGEPAEALPHMPLSLEGGRVEVADGDSRPSTRGRRDSTKQVVVEEVPEKAPEPDGMTLI